MTESLRASHTAVLVCQGRAAAHGLIAPGRFADPTAMSLLRPDEREVVRWVRDGVVPRQWGQRVDFESVRACAELMVPRTVVIDDAVRVRDNAQLVILGAGLDGRAWRMPELAGTAIFEVDQPATQRDKRDRAAELEGPPPVFVPVDFSRDRLGVALADAGHRAELGTTWIWEGVVPYLTEADVAATVAELAECSAPGSRLIVNFQTPAMGLKLGQFAARVLMGSAGRPSPWVQEPWRSTWTPAAMAALLRRHGYIVAGSRRGGEAGDQGSSSGEVNLFDAAAALALPMRRKTSLRHSIVLVADLT
jgi:methyltransferase (TIGR00027 family)